MNDIRAEKQTNMRMIKQFGFAKESGQHACDRRVMANVQGKNTHKKPFPVNVKQLDVIGNHAQHQERAQLGEITHHIDHLVDKRASGGEGDDLESMIQSNQ